MSQRFNCRSDTKELKFVSRKLIVPENAVYQESDVGGEFGHKRCQKSLVSQKGVYVTRHTISYEIKYVLPKTSPY